MRNEIKFEIKNHIGILSETGKGWKKEINMVSWNGNPAKFDIREWNEDHSRMSRGITLTHEEAKLLRESLGKIFV